MSLLARPDFAALQRAELERRAFYCPHRGAIGTLALTLSLLIVTSRSGTQPFWAKACSGAIGTAGCAAGQAAWPHRGGRPKRQAPGEPVDGNRVMWYDRDSR